MGEIASGLEYIPAKTIVTRNKTDSWFGAMYNMNIYRGCSHGCIYCDSRSTCYRNERFDRVKAKENALALIGRDLAAKRKKGIVATGSMSDPYNPWEKSARLTRRALELIHAYEFGVAIATKGTLVTRDADVLADIGRHMPALVKITITAAEDNLARVIEPGAPPSSERFAAVETLARAGIFTGLLMMPLLPWVNDSVENVLAIVDRAAAAGARFIFPSFGLTMRDGQREYFLEKLDTAFPGLEKKYLDRFGARYGCGSPRASLLRDHFEQACRERKILYGMGDIVRAAKDPYADPQMTLF